ncbi:hypothetical protein O1M63_03140 [Streptomyces mirabilis]|nr:hypothetical protein [Streptomyces mirabilis]
MPPDARAWVRGTAAELTTDADRIATYFTTHERPAPGRSPWPTASGHHLALPTLIDLEVWLTDIDHQLARIEDSVGPTT